MAEMSEIDIFRQKLICLNPEFSIHSKSFFSLIQKSYHSPTMKPMAAMKAMIPTKVEKWQAVESMFITQTSAFLSAKKNQPEEDTEPKTIMAKSWKKKGKRSLLCQSKGMVQAINC